LRGQAARRGAWRFRLTALEFEEQLLFCVSLFAQDDRNLLKIILRLGSAPVKARAADGIKDVLAPYQYVMPLGSFQDLVQ